MTNPHPITPPEKLMDEWESEWHHSRGQDTYEEFMAKQAARWGADQELDACCEWVGKVAIVQIANNLRAARRPKPPNLKEQALAALRQVGNCEEIDNATFETIRRALEALPND